MSIWIEFSKKRTLVQNLLIARTEYGKKPYVFVNSIPKSGTHLLASILSECGYRNLGHYNNPDFKDEVLMRSFSTGHTLMGNQSPINILLFRDPASVLFSSYMYINKRKDHKHHQLFKNKDPFYCFNLMIDGFRGFESMLKRYENFLRWGVDNNAQFVSYNHLRTASSISLNGIDKIDRKTIDNAASRWNPTKRTKRAHGEAKIKNDLKILLENEHLELINVYKKYKSFV